MRLLLGILFLLSACAEPVQRRFPIGIYDVENPAILPELKDMGFDSIETGASKPETLMILATEAQRLGMRIFTVPYPLRDKQIDQARDWPIEAWYLSDEPDVHRTPASVLEGNARNVRQWDSKNTLAFVIGQGTAAATYGHIGDVVLLDWYPVPHLPLDSVADHVDMALKDMPPGKPLWMIVQAFDWRDARQRDPTKPKIGRFPDFAEVRFMTYISIVHGATGIYYYTLKKPGGRTLFDVPEEFQAVWRVARELKAMQPIFERGTPVPLPFDLLVKGQEAKAFRYKSRDYVIILNRRADRSVLYPEELRGRRWRPLFEHRRRVEELLFEGRGGYFLRPRQVLVLESARNHGLNVTKSP